MFTFEDVVFHSSRLQSYPQISDQGILKGDVSLYHRPPVWLVWNQQYDNWQFLLIFAKQTNPNRSNRRSTVLWYFPFSIPWSGQLHVSCTVDLLFLLFDWFGISCKTTDNFCFYLQNWLIQTSQTGGQWYSDTSPFSIPWLEAHTKWYIFDWQRREEMGKIQLTGPNMGPVLQTFFTTLIYERL